MYPFFSARPVLQAAAPINYSLVFKVRGRRGLEESGCELREGIHFCNTDLYVGLRNSKESSLSCFKLTLIYATG